jgi:hypothetical protein
MNNTMFRDVMKGPHTVWIDNFAKIKKLHIPTLDMGAWQNCAWTGKALRKGVDSGITMQLMHKVNGDIIPAMPDKPFRMVSTMITMFKAINDKAGTELHDTCLATVHKVKTVPLKPKPKHMIRELHKDALTQGWDKLTNMYPCGLLDENIGSNIGLLRILRSHYENENQHLENCNTYTAFNVDTNIFDRMLKVPPPPSLSWCV